MNEFLAPFERLLATIAAPAALREYERGESAAPAIAALEQSGFLDALVPEAEGGAGLALAMVCPLVQAIGGRAVPLAIAETMIARKLLAGAGGQAPPGLIAFADSFARVPAGSCAGHALVDASEQILLIALEADQRSSPDRDSTRSIAASPSNKVDALPRPAGGLRSLGALIRTATIAGAAGRLVEMTVGYANERVQFGKPIGRQQAIQQQIAVMAEDAVAVRIAAEFAFAQGLPLNLLAVAAAKSVASEAAPRIANTSHAVHGAIGMSAEHDLQLYTRRLHEWRLADGTESYWNRILGADRLAADADSASWIRERLFCTD